MNSNQSKNSVTENLQIALASTYGLYLMTHNYHWNVEGKRFTAHQKAIWMLRSSLK